jgi:hypothetical protein
MTVQTGNVLTRQAAHKLLPSPPQRGGDMGKDNKLLTVQYIFYNVHSTKKKIK